MSYPKNDIIHYAVDAAISFHKDNKLFNDFVKDGFFNEQLEHLLRTAEEDRVAGARLMPIFYAALYDAATLKIPALLYKKIFAQIEHQRQKDGFAIRVLSPDKIVVVPADDVEFA